MNLNAGGQGDVTPVMNVTPLVDIVLVLLIIFMVVTPLLTKKFWIHTPKQEKKEVEEEQPKDPTPPLVLRIAADKTITVNGQVIGYDELPERLKRMFAARDDHILFFDAEDAVPYGYAVQVMDQARAGHAVTIATLIQALSDQAVPAGETPAAPAPAPAP
ncbi:MAG: biopolymer transporter ExbD [bacterium]